MIYKEDKKIFNPSKFSGAILIPSKILSDLGVTKETPLTIEYDSDTKKVVIYKKA